MKKIKEIYENGVQKAKEFGKKAKAKAGEIKAGAAQFLIDNPGAFVPLIGAVGMLIGGASAMADRKTRASEIKDENWTGGNFRTTHPLSNDELLELERRLKQGKEKGEALDEMGVLKKEKRRKA